MLLIKNVFFIVLFFFAAEECVYTFGRGQYGQLGHGTFLFQVDLPKPLEHFWNGSVKHIACGENHTAVITSKQSFHVYILFEPVQSYIKVAFKANLYYYYWMCLICHGYIFSLLGQGCYISHSVSSFIIDSGILYTFGDGRHGKLGLEEENFMNQFSPALCTCFFKYNVELVSKS